MKKFWKKAGKFFKKLFKRTVDVDGIVVLILNELSLPASVTMSIAKGIHDKDAVKDIVEDAIRTTIKTKLPVKTLKLIDEDIIIDRVIDMIMEKHSK